MVLCLFQVEDVREYDLDITSNDKYLNGAVPLNRSSNGHYKNGNVKMKMCGEGEEKVQDGSVSRLNGVADKHRKGKTQRRHRISFLGQNNVCTLSL